MKKRAFFLSMMLCLTACDTLDITGLFFGSSPDVNTRFAASKEYNDANGYRTITVPSEEYEVYISTDAHIAESAAGLTRFVEDYLFDAEAAPFAIFLGDAVEGKDSNDSFMATIEPVELGGRTLFCALGNHDIYFGRWDRFLKDMKTLSYCFNVQTPSGAKDLYICLDSASGTVGTSQMEWLEELLSQKGKDIRHTFVFTHTNFFKKDNSQGHTSNFNLEETYALVKLFAENGVDVVFSGHDHYFEDTVFKEVRYYTLSSICDKSDYAYYYKFFVRAFETKMESVRIR